MIHWNTRMARYNDSLQAQLDAAQEMLNANLLEDAWIVLNRLDAAYPESPEVIATMGDAALKVGDFEFAYEMFDRVIELEPVWSEAWSARARCRLEMCEFETARTDLEHAIALDPANPEAHYGLGILAEFDNDEVQARHEFAQAAMIDGDHFIIPFRTASAADFERLVLKVINGLNVLPDESDEIHFSVHELPSLVFCAETGLSPLITYYRADPDERNPNPPYLFFRRNIERVSRNQNEIEQEIEAVLIGDLDFAPPGPINTATDDLH